MTDWRLTVHDEDADKRLRRIALGLNDLRSFWPAVTRLAISWISRQMESEGAFAGRPWPPLSPAYAEWKEQRFPGRLILNRTGQLRRAATSPKRLVTPGSLTLTIESDIAPFHQEGTSRMPARPIVFGTPLPAVAQAALDAAAEAYISDLLRRF